MSIKLKLIISSLVTILGIVAVAAVGLLSLERTRDNINQLTSQSTPLQVKTLEFQQLTEQLVADFLKIGLAGNEAEVKRVGAAIGERLKAMDAIKGAIASLNPDSKLDTSMFHEAATTTLAVTAQRLKDQALFMSEAGAVNQALKEIETSIAAANHELAGLSTQAAKGVTEAQASGTRANATVKKLLTYQGRLKDIELQVGYIDAVQNKFRMGPLKERLKAAVDAIQGMKPGPEDIPLMKDIREAAVKFQGEIIREPGGLIEMRVQQIAGRDVDEKYQAVRQGILGGIAGIGSKVAEVIDPLESALVKEREKIDRALDFQSRAAQTLGQGNAVTIDSKETTANIRLLMLASSDKELDDVRTVLDGLATRMQQGTDKVRGQLRDLGAAKLAANAAQTQEAVKKSIAAIARITVAKAGVIKSERKMQELMDRIKTLVAEQSRQGEARVKATAQNQAEMVKGVNDGVRDAIFMMLVISGVLAALIIAMSIAITLGVTRPLNRMSSNVLAMEATGDLSRRIDMQGRDEVGRTVQAFNTLMRSMHSSISDINRVMGAVAHNDLTQRIEGEAEGDFNKLKEAINSSMQGLSETLKLIGDNTQGVAVAAEQTNQSIAQISEGSQSQLDAVNQLSAAIEQTTAAMAEMAKNAESTCVSARESAAIVKAGRLKMDEMVEVAEKISGNSTRISKISDMIGGIASQTNLLSLNASIEAARAGEAGRGFAVVAEEIGKLAKTVASSVQEISTLVGEAMTDSHSAVEMAAEVNGEMQKIERVSAQAEVLLTSISTAVAEQNAAMANISGNVRTLDSIAERNAQAAVEISATSQGLSALASQTRQQLDRFRLDAVKA
jgi:methyl-accepting chemotaxis protein